MSYLRDYHGSIFCTAVFYLANCAFVQDGSELLFGEVSYGAPSRLRRLNKTLSASEYDWFSCVNGR